MLVLALDTCDSRGSIALVRDESVLQVVTHDTSEDYSSWLLPAAQRVLVSLGAAPFSFKGAGLHSGRTVPSSPGLSLRDVSVYAVASGPGSFTGVRVGLTTVKAWSEVYGQPIAAVSRLEAIASYAASRAPYVAVFADAQRNQVFAALYRRTGTSLQRIEEEMVIAPTQFVEWVIANAGTERVEWISPDPKCVATTPQWPSRMALSETISVVAPVFAPAVGRIGLRLAQEGRLTDALHLDANYVRRSDAELLWKGTPSGVKP